MRMACPRCGSHNVQVIADTNTKGYDFCPGFLGWWLLGPIGLLCGMCGMGETNTYIIRVCRDCGAKFR